MNISTNDHYELTGVILDFLANKGYVDEEQEDEYYDKIGEGVIDLIENL